MIGFSQLQFPSRESSKLKFAGYFATFVSLSILVNPANVFLSFATIFFRSEIKAFYIYKEIKTAKRQKISEKEYWEIFFKNNTIKIASFFLLFAFVTYLTFTTTFLLISLLGTIPLTMLLILLQSELRPKDFNPFTLLKASMNFFWEGIKENSRGIVNSFDAKLEHLLPHQLNDDINYNINELKGKYGNKISEDVINDEESKQFIEYINDLYELDGHQFSDEDKGRVIAFLNDFCKDDQKHSSGFTGGQILLLVLRACNDGTGDAMKNKKDALIINLLDSQTFSRKERIPNTCFTGIIYRMLSTLEGIHPDPEIRFTPPRQVLLSEAENEARKFMLDRLKNKKNSEEILNAWYKVQNNYKDNESQKVVDDFIQEARIPLMRKLLGFTSGYTEQAVLTLIKNISSIKLNKLRCFELSQHTRSKLKKHGLDSQESLLENIEERVFLELLKQNLLKTDFSLKDSSLDEAKRIADTIIEEEVRKFKLKAENALESQINGKIDSLLSLKCEKVDIYYRILRESGYDDLNAARKGQIDTILNSKLQITQEEALKELLKLRIKRVYEASKGDISQLYEKIKEAKQGFIENGLLTAQEIDSIVKEKVTNLNKEDKIMPSSTLSRSLSVNNLTAHYL